MLSHQTVDLLPPRFRQTLHLLRRLPLQREFPLLVAVRRLNAGQDRSVKRVLEVFLSQSGAFGETHGSQLFRQPPSLLRPHGPLLVLGQVDQNLDVLSQVQLGAHQDQRRPGTVQADLGKPALGQVCERAGTDDAVAQEEDVCVFVAERTQTLQFILQAKTKSEQTNFSLYLLYSIRLDLYKGTVGF